MRIREVERLVGITTKNIRFYEEQGLIKPAREAGNGYREYTEEEVAALHKIKFLRKLSVPVEEIRRLQAGELTLESCMRRHIIDLEKEKSDIGRKAEMCSFVQSSGCNFGGMDVCSYLDAMAEMENEGVRFLDLKNRDRKAKTKTAVITSAVMIIIMCGFISIAVWGYFKEPFPIALLLACVLVPAAMIVGIVLALLERMKEIKGGEEDEAGKY